MSDVLMSGTYEKSDKIDDDVDGLYSFSFISDGNEYKFGYDGSNIIKYDWNIYKIHNNEFHKLLSLTD